MIPLNTNACADFPGGAIAMPKMLADEGTEYDDGTAATESQQAKVTPFETDTTLFLSFRSNTHS